MYQLHKTGIQTLIPDDSHHYQLTKLRPNCNLLPNLQTSDAINLHDCTEISNYGDGYNTFYLFRVLSQVKIGTVGVTLGGSGIDCSPVNGIWMSAISTSGNAYYCEAFAGKITTFGKITCTYSCNCSSGCVMFRATIVNPADKMICSFEA